MKTPACCGTAMLVAGTLGLVALTTGNSGSPAEATAATAPTGPRADAAAPPATPGMPTTAGLLTGYRPGSTAGPTAQAAGGSTARTPGGLPTGVVLRPTALASSHPTARAASRSPRTHTSDAAASVTGSGYTAATERTLQPAQTSGGSTNWAGYAATGTTFTAAQASWRQPPASCSTVGQGEVTLAGFWVGLDGYSSQTVEQIGTQTDCEGGTPVYYAWFELFPAGLTLLPADTYPLHAGDLIHAVVTQDRLRLQDLTAGWTKVQRFSPDALSFSSAEWVAEAPSSRLTDFGAISFTSATASTEASASQAIDRGEWSLHRIGLTGSTGASTGAISDRLSGSAFQVRWQHG